MKTIQLLVNDTKGAKFSHLTELKGNKKEKLELAEISAIPRRCYRGKR